MPKQINSNKPTKEQKAKAQADRRRALENQSRKRNNRGGRANKPANRDNQQKPVGTTDLAK